jgi:vancomycin resistance protein YoaR
MTREPKTATRDDKNRKKILIIIICILAAALVVTAMLFLGQVYNGLALEGVSVQGVAIGEMDMDQALAATSKIPQQKLSEIKISVDFDGETHTFTAEDLGLTTDYKDVVEKALNFGNTGNLFERLSDANTAKEQGKDFKVTVKSDRGAILAALLPIKEKLNSKPVDATFAFAPRGYLQDGTIYQPDEQEMIEKSAGRENLGLPEDLVRIPDDQMPGILRYDYWQNDHYVDDYIPVDANIARFKYTDEVAGSTFNIESVSDTIVSQVESGVYATIKAPVEYAQPAVTVDDLKKNTQLVASFTSSYSRHEGYNRNWNVAKLSGLINSVVIEPGEEWSINKHTGARTLSSGWLEAAGIVNGGYVPEAGGGVCQLSSTTYNAAIRAALDITDSTHHSISSDYIPLGFDATISTGGPDLKIKNPYDTPVYIVSYVNPEETNVTVEVYGPPVVNETYGEVILDFTSTDGGSYGTPGMQIVYNTPASPDGKPIAPGASYVYAQARQGRSVKTFIHYLSADGTELGSEDFHSYKWAPINGITYVNGPPPPGTPAATTVPAA